MAQGAAGHHGHDYARGGGQGGHNQTGFIADSAGGVLIDLHAGNRGKIDAFAGTQHAFGEAADFAVGHARKVDGHQEGRHLVIGDVAGGIASHQVLNLFGSELAPVAFPLDKVNCTHYQTLRLALPGVGSKGRIWGCAT